MGQPDPSARRSDHPNAEAVVGHHAGDLGRQQKLVVGVRVSGEELLDVTLHERTTLSGEEFNLEDWQAVLDDPILADKQAELQETLDKWEAEPPVE